MAAGTPAAPASAPSGSQAGAVDHGLAEPADRFCTLASGIRLCFRVHGPDDGEPLLLVQGLGNQLIHWPAVMLRGLVDLGFRVVVFDNRDIGRSSRIEAPPPSLLRQVFGIRDPAGYTLEHMAGDALGLLDHLGIARAHVLGMSMGGMVAQCLAAAHPHRVATLTSVFSTTGHRKVGQPALSAMWLLAKPPARDCATAVQRYLAIMAHVGSTRWPLDPQALRADATLAWARSGGGLPAADGESRQIGAIINSGDRTAAVRRITAPTLVVHGDVDRLVAPSGGRATADAIAGARLVTMPGLGHSLPDGAMPELLGLVDAHTRPHRVQHAQTGPAAAAACLGAAANRHAA